MMQVFRYFNGLMARRDENNDSQNHTCTTSKGLQMATYNVLPLSPTSGVSSHHFIGEV